MGQEQSHTSEGTFSAMTQKSRVLDGGRVSGGSSRTQRGRTSDIIVVNSADAAADQLDPDLKRIYDLPLFYPVLKSQLNIPGIRDSSDVLSKLDSKPILAICQCLQKQLRVGGDSISTEQASLLVRIREIDFAIATLNNYLNERHKRFLKQQNEFAKVNDIAAGVRRISTLLPEIVDTAKHLNSLLPPELQLEPLDLEKITKQSEFAEGTAEQRVLDQSS